MMTRRIAIAGTINSPAHTTIGLSELQWDGYPVHPRKGRRAGRKPARYFAGMLLALCVAGPAFAQAAAISLKITPADLKVIAKALDAPKIRARMQPLVVKLQGQVDSQFPAGPYATELPLPAIRGRDR